MPAFLQRVFSSKGMADGLALASIGATMANLNAGMVARQRLPLPPLSEQRDIVCFADRVSEEVDAAITKNEHEISLIREYRTRLIADVVTGQLDVREAAARLPAEEPDEPSGADVEDEDDSAGEDSEDLEEEAEA